MVDQVNAMHRSMIHSGHDAHVDGPKKDDPAEKMKGFLTLFIEQIKNKGLDDKPEDIMEKYAQMASVEQGMKLESRFKDMANQMSSLVALQLPNMLGQTIETPMGHGELKEGGASFVYSLDKDAMQTRVCILDDEGNTIKTIEGKCEKGTHTAEWDGMHDSGYRLNDGTYKIRVDAFDKDGGRIDIPQVLKEVIEGVDIKQRKIVVGGRLVDPSSVNQISAILDNNKV